MGSSGPGRLVAATAPPCWAKTFGTLPARQIEIRIMHALQRMIFGFPPVWRGGTLIFSLALLQFILRICESQQARPCPAAARAAACATPSPFRKRSLTCLLLCGIFSGAGAAERLCRGANRAARLVRAYKPDGPASQETRLIMPAMAARTFTRTVGLSMAITLLGLLVARSAAAFNYVADASGTYWGIQDDAPPRVDTGSIRATQIGPGQSGAYSTSINGFGGIRVAVQTTAAGRFNGEV